jgi:hypothetical protein
VGWYKLSKNEAGDTIRIALPAFFQATLTGLTTYIAESDFGEAEKLLIHLEDEDGSLWAIRCGLNTVFTKIFFILLGSHITNFARPYIFGIRQKEGSKVVFPIVKDGKTDFQIKWDDYPKKTIKGVAKIDWDGIFPDLHKEMENLNSKIKNGQPHMNMETGEVTYPDNFLHNGEPIF